MIYFTQIFQQNRQFSMILQLNGHTNWTCLTLRVYSKEEVYIQYHYENNLLLIIIVCRK